MRDHKLQPDGGNPFGLANRAHRRTRPLLRFELFGPDAAPPGRLVIGSIGQRVLRDDCGKYRIEMFRRYEGGDPIGVLQLHAVGPVVAARRCNLASDSDHANPLVWRSTLLSSATIRRGTSSKSTWRMANMPMPSTTCCRARSGSTTRSCRQVMSVRGWVPRWSG